MSVHQLKDGRWIAKFPKGTLPDDPDRTRQYFGRGIEAETAASQLNDSLSLKKNNRTLNAGGDLKGVSEMVGHSRTETTTLIYQHTNINLHRGIVDNLPPIKIDN